MLKRIDFPELFFGLVAPIGVDLAETVSPLKGKLEQFGYKVETIKVTDLFRHIDYCDVTLQDKPSEARFDSYIEFGNRLRALSGDKAICASLVIDKITKGRGLDPKKRTHQKNTLTSSINSSVRKKSSFYEVFTASFFSRFLFILPRNDERKLSRDVSREITRAPTSINTKLLRSVSSNLMRMRKKISTANECGMFSISQISSLISISHQPKRIS